MPPPMPSAQRRLFLIAVAILVIEILATVLAVALDWPAQFGGVGTDAGEEWASRGTAISPPLVPLILLGIAAGLLLVRARAATLLASVVAAILGVLFAIGSIGEAVADATPDVSQAVLLASGITGTLMGVALVAGAAATLRTLRGVEAGRAGRAG